jgi:hypothetical protein
MPSPTESTGRLEASALLVGIDDETAEVFAGALRVRGLGVRRVDAIGESASIHGHTVAVVIARAQIAGEFAELCDACLAVPVIGVLGRVDAEADSLRAGCAAIVITPPGENDVRLALERALSSRGAPLTNEVPPPAPKGRGMLGDSEPIRRVTELVRQDGRTHLT